MYSKLEIFGVHWFFSKVEHWLRYFREGEEVSDPSLYPTPSLHIPDLGPKSKASYQAISQTMLDFFLQGILTQLLNNKIFSDNFTLFKPRIWSLGSK